MIIACIKIAMIECRCCSVHDCMHVLHMSLMTDPAPRTVPDPHGHDMKSDSLRTSVTFKLIITLQNLITTDDGKSGKSGYDCTYTA